MKLDGKKRKLEENRPDNKFIQFLDEKVGGFNGKTVLELGPYEGYHTCSLCKQGAEKVVAIEGNPRNFLKCLIVKNHYQLDDAQFLLGNFLKYLRGTPTRFDFILAAGVLYHSAYPLALLNQITEKSDSIGICTTSYDADNVSFNMTGVTREAIVPGMEPIKLYQRLNDAFKTSNSKHGLHHGAWMMTEDDLLRYLDFRGFDVDVFSKGLEETTGASRIRFLARKRAVDK